MRLFLLAADRYMYLNSSSVCLLQKTGTIQSSFLTFGVAGQFLGTNSRVDEAPCHSTGIWGYERERERERARAEDCGGLRQTTASHSLGSEASDWAAYRGITNACHYDRGGFGMQRSTMSNRCSLGFLKWNDSLERLEMGPIT